MKVCHVSSAHKNDDARIFRLECVSLAAEGYDVYMVVEGESKDVQGVHIIGLGKQPESRLKRMTRYTRKAYQVALSLDCEIYHIHDPELLPYARKLKKHGKTVIFDSHENTLEQMEEKTWIPRQLRSLVSRMYRRYATSIFSELDCLVSVTPHIVEQLKVINPRTYMITNYPIVAEYPYREQKEEFALCFTGGIDSQWNHKLVIDAISELDGVTYNLCGRSSSDYIESLKRLSGWNKVNYFGKVPFSKAIEIQCVSSAGIALLSPSNNTGGMTGTIGNTKLFEYMMARLPLICTNFQLWKEIIEKYQCGICVPHNDIQALKEAILFLKNNPDEANKMGENGRRAVIEEYNWKTEEKIMFSMYEELAREVVKNT